MRCLPVEYDEKKQRSKIKEDKERENEILEHIRLKFKDNELVCDNKDNKKTYPWIQEYMPNKFVRVEEGKEIEGLRKILLELSLLTGKDIDEYIYKDNIY